MSDSLSGYSLRRGYSPHRNSSRRRRTSKTSYRKQGTPEEAQEETDSIFVDTYNDNPEHLYGKEILSLNFTKNSINKLIKNPFVFLNKNSPKRIPVKII